MNLFEAIISDLYSSYARKKQKYVYNATYISGYPGVNGGNLSVIIRLHPNEMAVHKIPLVHGDGELLFNIPYNKVVALSGDGAIYPSDDLYTYRSLSITVSGEDQNGKQYDIPIQFSIRQPWQSIPKLIELINNSKQIKI